MSTCVTPPAFETLPHWYKPKQFLASTNIVLVTRHSKLSFEIGSVLKKVGIDEFQACGNRIVHTNGARWIDRQNFSVLPYSATEIRQALTGQPTEFQAMPPGIQRSVWRYIKENRIYAVKS